MADRPPARGTAIDARYGARTTRLRDDCGSEADGIFLVRISSGASGVTPRGASTTFSDDLTPGTSAITLQVLSAPDNVGTYCLTITVDGVVVLDKAGNPAEGTSDSWTFSVPELGAALYKRVPPVPRETGGVISGDAAPGAGRDGGDR